MVAVESQFCSGRLVGLPLSPSVRNQWPTSKASLHYVDLSRQPANLVLRSHQNVLHSGSLAPNRAAEKSFLGVSLFGRPKTQYQQRPGVSTTHLCRAESRTTSSDALICPDVPLESATSSPSLKENLGSRIWFSDVIGHQKQNRFLDRSWSAKDIIVVTAFVLMHGGCLLAPSTFSWDALGVAAGLYFVTGCLGITLSFHRNLAHKSFKLPKPLEYLFAYCAVQAVQSGPLQWISLHRQHHLHTDTELDPHTPTETFWHAHIGWSMDEKSRGPRGGDFAHVADLQADPFYVFLERTYLVHPLLLGAALYAWGGLPYFVWGMCVRLVWMWHWTFSVNSAAHVWGDRPWNTADTSRNNWWVALITYGEGWHNNHHAFQYSARQGLEWWQYDVTWYVICLLEKLGLATEVKLPRPEHVARMKAISN